MWWWWQKVTRRQISESGYWEREVANLHNGVGLMGWEDEYLGGCECELR
jgi:hypothetical protein